MNLEPLKGACPECGAEILVTMNYWLDAEPSEDAIGGLIQVGPFIMYGSGPDQRGRYEVHEHQPPDGCENVFVTKTGRVLTDADIEKLADEAERGYDVSHLIEDEA